MKKNLVIVESPAKARTLEKFLGKDFKVIACGGHIRDLPAKKLGVDIEKDFEPTYIIIKGKNKIVKGLKQSAKEAKLVFLAPDPDREGEAIAWHLQHILGGDGKVKRIEFNEITKSAVQEAVKHPRGINLNRVNAQQARRILDRLVGYKLSPLLWKKVRKGLSAGRVQSVAVRLICEREAAIQDFKPQEYWSITADLKKSDSENIFQAKYHSKEIVPDKDSAEKIKNACQNAEFIIQKVTKKEQRRNPAPPFITSTLQQEAARKLGYSARKTMTIAQQLYEGVAIKGEDEVGLITYMRTDSVRIAKDGLTAVRSFIEKSFGKNYLPEKPRLYKTKKQAQDAHEAIRPTLPLQKPQDIKDSLTPEQYKLYNLIFNRFVACQMAQALLDKTSVDIKVAQYLFRATGSIIKFKGFIEIYTESKDSQKGLSAEATAKAEEDKEGLLPPLNEGEKLTLLDLAPKQHFTEPPPRYTEASLIRELEEKGIGRPSTYAPIMHTVEARGYVLRENKTFKPTELGTVTNEQLVKHFPTILDLAFTAHMEDQLDDIVAGKINYIEVLKEFYDPFEKQLTQAHEKMEKVKKEIKTSEICPSCGKGLVIRASRYGEFIACSGYPKCKYTKPIIKSLKIKCPRPGCDGEILIRHTRKGKIFYSCGKYPKCKEAYWDKPIDEKCPKCGQHLLVEKKTKTKSLLKCGGKECDYVREIT